MPVKYTYNEALNDEQFHKLVDAVNELLETYLAYAVNKTSYSPQYEGDVLSAEKFSSSVTSTFTIGQNVIQHDDTMQMTVKRIISGDYYDCEWISNGKYYRDVFHESRLNPI